MSQMSSNEHCASTTSSLHIMMFPFLAFGHISPFLQLARKISAVDSSVRFTILSAPANVSRINSLLSDYSSSPFITIHPLLLPRVPGLPEGIESTAELSPAEAQLLKIAVDGTKPQLHSLLSQTKPDFVVFDFAQPWLPSIASPLGVRTLFFSVFAAISFAYLVVPSRCPPGGPTPTADVLKTPPPGFPPASSISAGVPAYQARDCTYVYAKFNDGPTDYDRGVHCLTGCTAIVFKTCMEMEGQYIKYVESEYKKPILLAGPVVPEPPHNSGQQLDPRWADWLGAFGEGSVVFCCFGSEALILNKEGAGELLLGLEMTGMPFLVVLNIPHGEGEGEMRRRSLIPAGFEERVAGRGVVHCGWVQQQLILRHASVGCFVCHAGNSSFVEGVAAGCRLVFLPQRGDHYLHSALFAGDLGVGVEVSRDEDGGFRRDAICESVKKATTDAEVGEKHGKWREFLTDRRMEERYMVDFVGTLKALLLSDNEGK